MILEDPDLVQALVLGVITAIALLSNILICVTVYKHPWILYPTNDLVISLALLDILTAAIPLPLTIGVFISETGWTFGKAACSVYAFFDSFPKYASVLTLLIIAIQRYYRFIKPREYNETFTPGYTLIFLATVWIGATLTAVFPVMVSWAEYRFSIEYLGCLVTYKQSLQQSMWNTFILVLFEGIPTFLIFSCYHLVYRSIGLKSGSRNRVTDVNAQPLNNAKKYRITKTFLVISVVFVVCWLPPSIVLVIDQLFSTHLTLIGARILHFSTAVSSASKVFIYAWVNRPFRRELFNLLGT